MFKMKETIELGSFIAKTIDAAIASAKGDQSLIERLTNFVPALISAQAAFAGIEGVDEEVEVAGKEDFDSLTDSIYNDLTNVKMPLRGILANIIASGVGVAATTVLDDNENTEPEPVVA
jgi:hypothetical protein